MEAAPPIGRDEAAALLRPVLEAARTGVVLAVSGGPDSTALMGLVAETATEHRARILVATIDHGLRAASAREAADVARLADRLRLPHRILVWRSEKPASRIQERAREARYALLAEAAGGSRHIVTAHTLDDQAETILMRLLRGSGPEGLSGMKASGARGDFTILRPFLAVPKARLIATCRDRGWPYHADPSNEDPRFLRPRLRRLAPLLAAEGLSAERLARVARRIALAEEALDRYAADAFASARRPIVEGLALDSGALGRLPADVLRRVLALAIRETARQGSWPPRLERLETLTAALGDALAGAAGFPARTLGGVKIALGASDLLLHPEPPRRAGVRPREVRPPVAAVIDSSTKRTEARADDPGSLGNGRANP